MSRSFFAEGAGRSANLCNHPRYQAGAATNPDPALAPAFHSLSAG